MHNGAKFKIGSLLVVLTFCALLTACVSELDTTAAPVSDVSPTATRFSQATETNTGAKTPAFIVENQPAETRLSTAVTQPPSSAPSPTPTTTQPPATATASSTPAASNTPTSTQPSPAAQTETPQPTPPAIGAPQIAAFTASPDNLSKGESVTLNWETEGGKEATLCSLMNLQGESTCFDVPLVGTHVVDTAEEASIYEFTLTVTNEAGARVATKYVCTDENKLFFEDPPQKCGSSPPIYSYAAAQRFEHGLLIWVEATDEFFIFWDDGNDQTLDPFTVVSGPLKLKPDASVDNRVGDVPAGYYEPVSGFGLIWRGEVVERADLRDSLGWALEPEFGFDTVYQHGIVSNWHYFDRYIRDPDGRVRYLWGQAYLGTNWSYLEEWQ